MDASAGRAAAKSCPPEAYQTKSHEGFPGFKSEYRKKVGLCHEPWHQVCKVERRRAHDDWTQTRYPRAPASVPARSEPNGRKKSRLPMTIGRALMAKS
mmetsp:Transcript_91395/g.258157  ORF Transcript_91395/g.258157 Transcript_91395/m.258157 type:complete len:98 (-) Transcript_91395:20-313(-)